MPLRFNWCKIANNVCNQLVARVLPHPAHGWIGGDARTFLSAPPLPDPLPHSKQWRRGGHGVLDGGRFFMAGWNFAWLAKYLIELGRANPNGTGRGRPRHVGQATNRGGHNPVGFEGLWGRLPRVARSSQPWAGGHNPFGIEITGQSGTGLEPVASESIEGGAS